MVTNSIIFRYIVFAILATIANLLTQRVLFLFDNNSIMFVVAILSGTIVGLVIKYTLDKRWIFYDSSKEFKDHKIKFYLYTVMSIMTTLIFWGIETLFWFFWKTEFMREIGALLGLTIGYFVKYNLDRKFVFINQQLRVKS